MGKNIYTLSSGEAATPYLLAISFLWEKRFALLQELNNSPQNHSMDGTGTAQQLSLQTTELFFFKWITDTHNKMWQMYVWNITRSIAITEEQVFNINETYFCLSQSVI